MAKRFSIVNINNEQEVFIRGFIEPKDLSKSKIIVGLIAEKSSFEKYPFVIEHCLLLDFPGEDEDISVEDFKTLLDVFDDLVEDDYISVEEVIEFELYGLGGSDKIVEG